MAATLTNEMIEGAKKLQSEKGIPASLTLAQIILESSGKYEGGLTALAYKHNNLFGHKGTGSAGSVIMPTKEYQNGRMVTVNESFAKYASVGDSIERHGEYLTKSRYTQYTSKATTLQEYVQGIKDGNYATDPDYVSKIMNVIEKNNLTQYDNGNYTFTGSQTASENDTDLKWYGDIAVVIFMVILIIIGLILFISAFGGSFKGIKEKTVKKALKVVE